eukprot:gene10234-2654_t
MEERVEFNKEVYYFVDFDAQIEPITICSYSDKEEKDHIRISVKPIMSLQSSKFLNLVMLLKLSKALNIKITSKIEEVHFLKTEYFLITGNPDLIQKNLEDDVKAIVHHCDLAKENERQLSYCEDPTIQEFESFLKNRFQNTTAKEIIIIYCGHGTSDGSLVLNDGDYSGSNFKEFLNNLKLKYLPHITIYLNCCYALQFVNHIVEKSYKNFFTQLLMKNNKEPNIENVFELFQKIEKSSIENSFIGKWEVITFI